MKGCETCRYYSRPTCHRYPEAVLVGMHYWCGEWAKEECEDKVCPHCSGALKPATAVVDVQVFPPVEQMDCTGCGRRVWVDV